MIVSFLKKNFNLLQIVTECVSNQAFRGNIIYTYFHRINGAEKMVSFPLIFDLKTQPKFYLILHQTFQKLYLIKEQGAQCFDVQAQTFFLCTCAADRISTWAHLQGRWPTFIHSSKNYLLSVSYLPPPILGYRDTAMNKTNQKPLPLSKYVHSDWIDQVHRSPQLQS